MAQLAEETKNNQVGLSSNKLLCQKKIHTAVSSLLADGGFLAYDVFVAATGAGRIQTHAPCSLS